jgi:hypothetical protein
MRAREVHVPVWEQGMRIPHVVHQTFGTRALPDSLQRNVDAIRALNPDWDYLFYDDADIERVISELYGEEILSLYRRINPAYGAARADLFRYLLIYRHGGIYLDIKSSSTRPLTQIVEGAEGPILAKWDNGPGGRHPNWGLHRELEHIAGGELQQWHIIAPPGHPFIRAVILRVLDGIERYRPWRDGVGRDGVINLTGPIAYTLAITPLLASHPHKLAHDEREIGLEYSVVPGTTHKALFRTHYVDNMAPVVTMRGIRRPVAGAHSLYLRMRRLAGRAKGALRKEG